MKLTLGFSPCPNDTFIFDAIVNSRIDLKGLSFEVKMGDVEELNQLAFDGELDITKLSYNAFGHLIDKYVLLESGSALGKNCGPLLIKKKGAKIDLIENAHIAIPGKYTSANFLLQFAFPKAKNKVEFLFSNIEKAVLSEAVDAGVIIHENRFTYADRGMEKILDLGEFWEEKTQLPIPLGGIVIKRSIPKDIQLAFNEVLFNSISYAFEHPEYSLPFIKQHAQEMDSEVMKQHIELYVNEYSLKLGKTGRKAIERFFHVGRKMQLFSDIESNIFLI